MSSVIKYWFLSFCFLTMQTSCYIYEVQRMVKKNQGNESIFIGLSDFHDKSNPINKSQLQELDNALSGLNANKTKFVVEDLSSRNTQGRYACGNYFINSRGGILGGLSEAMHSKGLAVDNIEFRYCRVTSLGPILNNLHAPLSSFAPVMNTKVGNLIDEINLTIEEIRTYNDGLALKKLFEVTIKEIYAQLVVLNMQSCCTMNVAEYMQKYSTQANRLELLKKLLTLDSSLIDFKLVHAIVNAGRASKVIAIAGGSHIVRVCELLEKVGYKKAAVTNIKYAKEFDLQRCLGSHIIEGSYCVKPRPLEAREISRAIK